MRAVARDKKRRSNQTDKNRGGKDERRNPQAGEMRRQMLAWYDANRRDLPWRRTSDPYAIWISEIMLQQTRVAAVVDRFQVFLSRFPTVASLAQAREEDVLALWSGLGYYRRARMLHKAAKVVVTEHDGKLPDTAAALKALPGIGDYTAAAIASIAFGERAAVVDGNVERVICRLEGWDGGAKTNTKLRKQIEALAGEMIDRNRPGDFNQALMELGATLCLPRNPQCLTCPLVAGCATRGEHKSTPRKPMRNVEVGYGLALRGDGDQKALKVLLVRRTAAATVMPGMWELPALVESSVPETQLQMTVHHSIMQVNYLVRIQSVTERELRRLTVGGKRQWFGIAELGSLPLTGLARKVLIRAKLLTTAGVRSLN